MHEITTVTDEDRIFYLHEFIYFADAIDYVHSLSISIQVRRILELLILFDRVLIPAEHLSISSSDAQNMFKRKFLEHPIINELIENGRLITTIWGACSDVQQHFEATDRYRSVIGANILVDPVIKAQIAKMRVFLRNQKNQSASAYVLARRNGWIYHDETDLLSYSDGPIEIPFSHERLLLGDGVGKFTDELSISAAKLAYIQAMPSGNGGIYRSLVSSIEIVKGEGFSSNDDRLPPAFFCPSVYRAFIEMIGITLPPDTEILSPLWRESLYEATNTRRYKAFQNKLFKALEWVAARVPVRTEGDAKKALGFLHVINQADSVAMVLQYCKNSGALLQRAASALLRRQLQDYWVILPIAPIVILNYGLRRNP
jgi:hypothetical protein